jgi:hypothetical protein
LVLLEVDWSAFEPKPPPAGVDPTNPGGPEYNFAYLDGVLREFRGTGISAAFLVSDAPSWAEAPGGPTSLEARGAWRPNPTAYHDAATALARRYSGSYPDPLFPGRTLPRVRYYQAWAEANFEIHLAPQWVSSGGSWVPAAPAIYRGLLNAFYAGVKSVHSDNVVITSGTGPFGDPSGPCANQSLGDGCRMPPVMFDRELLCLNGQAMTPGPCPNPAHFDALAMDPYEAGSPTTHAYYADDVSAPDLGKLTSILNRANTQHRVLPQGHKQLWVTEFSYDSKPPNPTAVSLATQAKWLEESFYLFWKQGVSTAVWYLVRDQAGTAYTTTYYSGVYFNNGTPKPAYEAFRFPFVVWPNGRQATVWGISPRTGTVTVQRRQGRSWTTLFKLRVPAGGVFVRNIPAQLRGRFRAVDGPESSLVWTR